MELIIVLVVLYLIHLFIKYNPNFDLSKGDYGYRLYLWYNYKGERKYKILYPFTN